MGFTGIKNVNDSDNAASLAYQIGEAMAKILKKEVRMKDNVWNTNGDINVGLIFREVIVPAGEVFFFNEGLQVVAKRALKSIEGPGWFGNKNRNRDFDPDTRGIVKALKTFIENGQ